MLGAEAMQGINEASFGAIESNNLYTGYLKSSIDIGESLSLLGGMSIIHGENFENNSLNPTDIYGIDFTLREQLGSYSSLLWQNEYIQREKNAGTRVDKQAGFYSELIYTYNNNYATGLRYDAITQNDTDNLDRFTAMLEYKPFEMSRLRLSYTYDRSKIISGERKNINEVMLSLNISAGAHSAHDF